MSENIGHAILIAVALYFHYAYNMPAWITVFFIFFAIVTWETTITPDEQRALLAEKRNLLIEVERFVSNLNRLFYVIWSERSERKARGGRGGRNG